MYEDLQYSTDADLEIRHNNTGRVYFSIKRNIAFAKNSIGNFAVLLDPRMLKAVLSHQ